MSTKSLGPGFKIVGGKVKAKPPRMAPVLASAQKHKADREEKAWMAKSTSTRGIDADGKASAAKSRRAAR